MRTPSPSCVRSRNSAMSFLPFQIVKTASDPSSPSSLPSRAVSRFRAPSHKTTSVLRPLRPKQQKYNSSTWQCARPSISCLRDSSLAGSRFGGPRTEFLTFDFNAFRKFCRLALDEGRLPTGWRKKSGSRHVRRQKTRTTSARPSGKADKIPHALNRRVNWAQHQRWPAR